MSIIVTGTLRGIHGETLPHSIVHFIPVIEEFPGNTIPGGSSYLLSGVSVGADEDGKFEAILDGILEYSALYPPIGYVAEIYHKNLHKMIRFKIPIVDDSTLDISTAEELTDEDFFKLLQTFKIGRSR